MEEVLLENVDFKSAVSIGTMHLKIVNYLM